MRQLVGAAGGPVTTSSSDLKPTVARDRVSPERVIRSDPRDGSARSRDDPHGTARRHSGDGMATRTDQASTVVGAPAEAAPAYLELRALAIASAVDELVFGTDQLRWRRAMSRLGLVDHAARHVGHACSADVRVSRAVGFTATADVFDRFAGFLDAGGELRRRPFKSAEQAAAERVGGAVLVDGNRPRTAGRSQGGGGPPAVPGLRGRDRLGLPPARHRRGDQRRPGGCPGPAGRAPERRRDGRRGSRSKGRGSGLDAARGAAAAFGVTTAGIS